MRKYGERMGLYTFSRKQIAKKLKGNPKQNFGSKNENLYFFQTSVPHPEILN